MLITMNGVIITINIPSFFYSYFFFFFDNDLQIYLARGPRETKKNKKTVFNN